jgi:hypothetical protein
VNLCERCGELCADRSTPRASAVTGGALCEECYREEENDLREAERTGEPFVVGIGVIPTGDDEECDEGP